MNAAYERLLDRPVCRPIWPRAVLAPCAGRILAESLGEAGADLLTSLSGRDVTASLEADRRIAKSTYLLYNSGLFRYARFAPNDSHLHLWCGLYLEANGSASPALAEYARAIQGGLHEWRVQWYFARTLRTLGEEAKARPIYTRLRATVQDFDTLTGDDAYRDSPPRPAVIAGKSRVTALVSTYNAEAFMEGCLQNLVNQSLYRQGGLEIVVVDAASPQNERGIVEAYQARHDGIRYVRAPERETLYKSWNRGIALAHAPYLTSANTDDRHREDALAILADFLDDHPEIALVYPGQIDTSVPNETFATTASKKRLDWPPYSYRELERHCIVGSQPVWRRDLHETYGLFRDSLVSAGDYEFWLRIGKRETFYRHPETLGLYYRNPHGLEHRETIQIWEEYGMFDRGVLTILDGKLFTRSSIRQYLPDATPRSARSLPDYIVHFQEHLSRRDFAAAGRIAEDAVRAFPRTPFPLVLRAITCRLEGRFGPALESIEKSLAIEESPEALYELIQTSIATNHLAEARQAGAYLKERYPAWAGKVEAFVS
jgi:glycosyltransferase involved in cell wall biosynthesis